MAKPPAPVAGGAAPNVRAVAPKAPVEGATKVQSYVWSSGRYSIGRPTSPPGVVRTSPTWRKSGETDAGPGGVSEQVLPGGPLTVKKQ